MKQLTRAALAEVFKLSEEDCKRVVRLLFQIVNLDQINIGLRHASTIIGGYGVEVLRNKSGNHAYFRDVAALYVNMGDTYKETILYEVSTNQFVITSWGDWFEANEESLDLA